MAFKQSAIMVADRGTQEAVKWLSDNSAGTALQNTDRRRRATSPPGRWSSPTGSTPRAGRNRRPVNGGAPDASGNVVRYVVHRMCTQPDTPYNGANAGVANECALYFATSAAAAGGSMAVGAPQFIGSPQLYYRVTTRVEGPRDTVSVIQTSVLVSI